MIAIVLFLFGIVNAATVGLKQMHTLKYCQSYEEDIEGNTKCTKCVNPLYYMLIDGECHFIGDENCVKFTTDINGNNICIKCEEGYALDRATRQCVVGEEKCEEYNYNTYSDKIYCQSA